MACTDIPSSATQRIMMRGCGHVCVPLTVDAFLLLPWTQSQLLQPSTPTALQGNVTCSVKLLSITLCQVASLSGNHRPTSTCTFAFLHEGMWAYVCASDCRWHFCCIRGCSPSCLNTCQHQRWGAMSLAFSHKNMSQLLCRVPARGQPSQPATGMHLHTTFLLLSERIWARV